MSLFKGKKQTGEKKEKKERVKKIKKIKQPKQKKHKKRINAQGQEQYNKKKINLHNISIGWKYGLVIIFIFTLLTISTALVTQSILGLGKDLNQVEDQSNRAVLTTELSELVQSKGLSAMNYLQFGNATHLTDYEAKEARIDELLEYLEGTIKTEQQQSLYDEVIKNNNILDETFYDEVVKNVGADEEVRRLYSNRFSSATNTTSLYLTYLKDLIIEDRDLTVKQADSSQQMSLFLLLGSMVGSIVIGIIAIVFISRYISKNLNQVVKASDIIASGDLSREPIQYQGLDEIGRLSNSINGMQKQLLTMINKINETSVEVKDNSMALNQSAQDVKVGTEQIAITMEELATGTESQATYAGDLADTMKAFTDRIHSISQSSETINQSSNVVLEETLAGNSYMKKSINQMTTIDAIVKEAVLKVKGLDKQSKEISKLVNVIKDIADQTNLLALNAAIEAARAGEHGKGFAVVADEVRKLAEQVNHSIGDITSIVQTIQVESNTVSDALSSGNAEVEQGKIDIEKTGERFRSIEQAIDEMTSHVKTVMSGLQTLAEESEQVNGSVQEIASISQESAAGVEETSASAEEASTSMEAVAKGADALSESAETLNDLIRQFKTQ